MIRAKVFTVLLGAVLFFSFSAAAVDNKSINFPIRELYSAPSEDSNLIYKIPIEVKLLDVSGDGNWYKVKLSYAIGPFSYTYVGWAEIPVGEILATRVDRVAKTTAP